MRERRPPAPFRHEIVAFEQIADGAPCRPRPLRVFIAQDPQQLLGAPARMPPPRLEHRRDDRRGGALRARVRTSTAIRQRAWAALVVAVDPLVGGLAADAEPGGELGYRLQAAEVVRNELCALIHQ